ncbi:hypothetical protein DFH27DRAFT_649560 [Peziza echinospora]|nr:hypothetical protein DFH27DRAFT_649560 [Peziza echinospora]
MSSTGFIHRTTELLSLSLPAPTTSRNVVVYLVFLVLSSISLFVFLNSTISFVITDILEIRQGKHGKNILGDLVGTLGLVDELVVIVSVPLWGVISDRWKWGGRKGVSALGFFIAALGLVGLSGVGLVRGKNGRGKGIQLEGLEWWYWLVFFRALFAVGGGAISTMISAVLPDLTSPPSQVEQYSNPANTILPPPHMHQPGTATPTEPRQSTPQKTYSPSSKLAGIVGLFSGIGALVALSIFLPLPTLLDPSRRPSATAGKGDGSESQSGTGEGLKRAYWVVATYAIICGTACWFGLPHYSSPKPPRRNSRHRQSISSGTSSLWNRMVGNDRHDTHSEEEAIVEGRSQQRENIHHPSGVRMFIRAIGVGRDRWRTIGISYVGGFIARAASVGLSLFIPLFVNHYFITKGLCNPTNPNDKEQMKKECQRAYILAAELSGISQFIGLISAPAIGYLSSPALTTASTADQKAVVPLRVLAVTSLLGTIGFVGFGFLESPEIGFFSLLYSSLLGIGQIGAIVGSLGLLGRGQGEEFAQEQQQQRDERDAERAALEPSPGSSDDDESEDGEAAVTTSLLRRGGDHAQKSHQTNPGELKGSIAGVYSLAGGFGILLLTKGGGLLFDKWSPGAPFWVVGAFMGLLALLTGWEGWVKGLVL